ncbi:MAG: hypothetical protein QOG23_1676 [Blastocatellia bacterium]|jgi:hypothetical protein|nr:hypothetical protein [Blastocatellia bacterium]
MKHVLPLLFIALLSVSVQFGCKDNPDSNANVDNTNTHPPLQPTDGDGSGGGSPTPPPCNNGQRTIHVGQGVTGVEYDAAGNQLGQRTADENGDITIPCDHYFYPV